MEAISTYKTSATTPIYTASYTKRNTLKKKEAASIPEALITIFQHTRRHKPEDVNLHQRHCENLRSGLTANMFSSVWSIIRRSIQQNIGNYTNLCGVTYQKEYSEKKEAESIPEALITVFQHTRRRKPENVNLHLRHCENLRSCHIVNMFSSVWSIIRRSIQQQCRV